MKITRGPILIGTTYLWLLFVVFSWRDTSTFGILDTLGFLVLIILPGLLTQFGLKMGRALPYWHRFGQIIGTSIIEIFLWIIFCNTVLPHLHVDRPLDRHPLLMELSVLYIGLLIWAYINLKNIQFRFTRRLLFKSQFNLLSLCIPLIFIILSVGGAISLNNGGTNALTLIMLFGIACYFGVMMLWRNKLHDNTFAWTIYMISVSLLFMTSLRGWFVTGHDIQHEFQVFQITKQLGVWHMSNQRDPYNACLSITILPTVFSNLLHVADPYIYKVYFQLIFAAVPTILYIFMRRYVTKAKALLAVIFFIGFPTFYTDMPFLNRQEIAFLFLSLMLLVIFEDRMRIRKKQWLFIGFGLGMILAHYSTTYSVLLLLLFLVCVQPIFFWIAPKLSKLKLFHQSSINILRGIRRKKMPFITIPMVVMLFYFCFIWFTVITNTATGASNILIQVVDSVKNGLNADARSSDVSYSIFSPQVVSPKQQLQNYVTTVVDPARKHANPLTYYPTSVVKKYPVSIVNQYDSPPTALGKLLDDFGINVSNFNYIIKQSSAKLLQIVVLVGLCYVLVRKKYNNAIEPQFFLLAVASLVFVFLQVVLPDVSQSYGILRAFQQSLMVLGLLVVIGLFALASLFRKPLLTKIIPPIVTIAFFLTSTGVVSQILGGYQAQLFLNNSGQYYSVYYTHKQELASIAWLNTITDETKYGANTHALLQTDEFDSSKLSAYTKIPEVNDVNPGLIQPYAYVYLGYNNVTTNQAAIFYNGDLISYTFPTNMLNQQKNLIYSNGGSEIYK